MSPFTLLKSNGANPMALPNPYILGPHDAYRGRIEACFVSTRNNGQRFGRAFSLPIEDFFQRYRKEA